jgi:hypothetical protein
VGRYLVERRGAVGAPEREREPGAGGRERLEAERGERGARACVPRVRDDERLALVERLEGVALVQLCLFHPDIMQIRSGRRPRAGVSRPRGRSVITSENLGRRDAHTLSDRLLLEQVLAGG